MDKKASSLPGYPVRLLRQQHARRMRNLRDPDWTGPKPDGFDRMKHMLLRDKHFPAMHPLMTTSEYIDQFQRINHHTRPSSMLQFTHRAGLPASYDASEPLFTEGVLL